MISTRYAAGTETAADHDDVGVIVRAIQSGVDVVPQLQRALAVQFAAVEELGELEGGEREKRGTHEGGDVERETDEEEDEEEEEEEEEEDA